MAVIANTWIKRETIEKLAESFKQNPEKKGIGVDIFIQNETNDWGQNVSMALSQTKEQREAKEKRWYVGNGEVKWLDDNGASLPDKKEEASNASTTESDDLPF